MKKIVPLSINLFAKHLLSMLSFLITSVHYIKNLLKGISNKLTGILPVNNTFSKTQIQPQNNYTCTVTTLINRTPIKTNDPAFLAGSFSFSKKPLTISPYLNFLQMQAKLRLLLMTVSVIVF